MWKLYVQNIPSNYLVDAWTQNALNIVYHNLCFVFCLQKNVKWKTYSVFTLNMRAIFTAVVASTSYMHVDFFWNRNVKYLEIKFIW